jgi:hypothetical protein
MNHSVLPMPARRTMLLITALLLSCCAARAQEATDSSVVRVLYFHGTIRCQTCLMIESFTDAVMRAAFQDAMQRGVIEWRAVDYEKENDTASVRRYGIENQALVLSRTRDGREAEWKLLPKVWKLVENYRRFHEYLETNVRDMMRRR